jgi:hypothetical protein
MYMLQKSYNEYSNPTKLALEMKVGMDEKMLASTPKFPIFD